MGDQVKKVSRPRRLSTIPFFSHELNLTAPAKKIRNAHFDVVGHNSAHPNMQDKMTYAEFM
jgi:hypothetical protein